MSDFTVLPRAIQDCMAKAGEPLSEDQYMLLAGYLAPVQQETERAIRRIEDLEQVATSVRRDLILRAEPDWDGSGQQVVNLSASIWDELNRVLDIKGNRREGQQEICNYPECQCPFDMGPDHQCLKGLPVIRK
jgi:hypothetical protein